MFYRNAAMLRHRNAVAAENIKLKILRAGAKRKILHHIKQKSKTFFESDYSFKLEIVTICFVSA